MDFVTKDKVSHVPKRVVAVLPNPHAIALCGARIDAPFTTKKNSECPVCSDMKAKGIVRPEKK